MGLFETYKADDDKTVNGIEVEIGYDNSGDPYVFKVAHIGQSNPQWAIELDRECKGKALDKMPEEMAKAKIKMTFCRAILKGWSDNITGPDGKPYPYSVDNAYYMMVQLPELYAQLNIIARDFLNYRFDSEAGVSKN